MEHSGTAQDGTDREWQERKRRMIATIRDLVVALYGEDPSERKGKPWVWAGLALDRVADQIHVVLTAFEASRRGFDDREFVGATFLCEDLQARLKLLPDVVALCFPGSGAESACKVPDPAPQPA
jgi:hypothetical protein